MHVPRTIHKALSQSNWKNVVFYEMSALEKIGTWEIIDLLKDINTMSCKWIFIVKIESKRKC